jgi:glycerol-3-phosphate dehydrogenase (NAD(P)+)
MKITVLSDGAWGTALATVLLHNAHRVVMWGPFPDYLETMAATRENPRFLPGVKLPAALEFNADLAAAVADADFVLLATPTQFLRSVLVKLQPCFNPARQILINVAKGIEVDTWLRVSEMVRQVVGETRFVALSGPSHAEEVSRRVPTAVTAASVAPGAAEVVQELFMNEFFRVYTSNDVVGVELGGALKNVMAIAAGIIDGMKLGDNPKAAMMTRAIAEMSRLGIALGGQAATFSGLSGIGDLIVTCCSGHSRNRHVGEELGRGKSLREILDAMGMVVAEGVPTTRGACALAHRVGVEVPIAEQVFAILYEKQEPGRAIRLLMGRSAKPE